MELIPTKNFTNLKYPFELFNPVQSDFIQNGHYIKDVNIIVSTQPNTGKTVIGELCIDNILSSTDSQLVIYVSPLKALSNEKYENWKEMFSQYNPFLLTGDNQLNNQQTMQNVKNSRLVIMTSEMFDSKSKKINSTHSWLKKCKAVIVDEVHMLGQHNDGSLPIDERGHRLESALINFTSNNKDAKIIFLSGTLPNSNELSKWLTSLNGKETCIYSNPWMPHQINWHFEIMDGMYEGNFFSEKQGLVKKAVSIIKENDNDMFIVFTHTKDMGRMMKNELKNFYRDIKKMDIDIPFHCSDMTKQQRNEIETGFKDKKIPGIVATSTLAYGVNLPARRTIILGIYRGKNLVHPYDIKQMGLRAGRIGIDPSGDVHVIVKNIQDRSVVKHELSNLPPIRSLISDEKVFAFHIISEIYNKNVKNNEDMKNFYKKSLAYMQNMDIDIDRIEGILIQKKTLKIDEDGTYQLTKLGEISVQYYFTPFDIYDWYTNFNHIFTNENILSDETFSWAWAATDSNRMGYIPKNCENHIIIREDENIPNMKDCHVAINGIYLTILGTDIIPTEMKNQIRLEDSRRQLMCIKKIDKMYGYWNKEDVLDRYYLRMSYGVKDELVDLCKLHEIGKVRAGQLFKQNIKNIDDLKSNKEKAIKIIGEKVYTIAISSGNKKFDDFFV